MNHLKHNFKHLYFYFSYGHRQDAGRKSTKGEVCSVEKDIDEVKKKEKMETENMVQKMKVKIEEMNEKIKKLKSDQNVKRSVIEELGESFVRMTMDYESAKIRPDVKEKLKMQ